MTPDNLIIEDFDFSRYEITRIYPLGGKTVIQIGEPISETPRNTLLSKIDDLEHDYKILEEEKESAESELEKAEKELNDLEEKHEEELDKIESSLESAEQFLGIETSERLIHRRIAELTRKIDENFQSEKVSGLEIDNNALADTIFRQEQTIANQDQKIADLERELKICSQDASYWAARAKQSEALKK
jgi:predicted  nucleic acid-binding Zn-ribbon protein